MIFQNFQELATNSRKKIALKILVAGLDAAFPEKPIKKNHKIKQNNYTKKIICVICF